MKNLIILTILQYFASVNTASVYSRSELVSPQDKLSLPQVTIPNLGTIQGFTSKSQFKQRTIYNFMGINYAAPPSGTLRFQPPQPFPAWRGIYNATKFRMRCPQVDMDYYPSPDPGLIDFKQDEEDCLVVNVFTPHLPANTTNETGLPVMYYIHGGSFWMGSAYDFLPEFLLDEDIVVVIVQYRLGALGFLSLHNDLIPGNAGMLDIVAGLRWVRDYIKYFGGDSTRVTVVGQSAGGAAASSLLVSPLAKDLYSQMIIQSGSSLGTWVVDDAPVSHARGIGMLAGCRETDLTELAKCLMKVPPMELALAHAKFVSFDIQQGDRGLGGNQIVVQKVGSEKFLTEVPSVLFDQGKYNRVPLMGGVTRDEGTAFLANVYDYLFTPHHVLNDTRYFSRNATRDTIRFCGIDDPTGSVTDLFQKYYFQPDQLGYFMKMYPGLIDVCGTVLLKASTYNVLRLMSTSQPTFAYSFHFYGNASKLRLSLPNWKEEYPFPSGVAHSDELGYLFPNLNVTYSEEELKVVKIMVGLWSNFVKSGNPSPVNGVPKWSAMDKENGPYMRISINSELKPDFTSEYEIGSKEGFQKANTWKIKSSNFVLVMIIIFKFVVS